VEKCESHSIVKGGVERSTKEDGTVMRKRRCDVCGDLISTIEMTEDQLDHIRVKLENRNRELRVEMANYRAIAAALKGMFAAEERARKVLEVEHETTEEDQF
jgi:transcriptional regulator NrdR family protein